MSKKILATILIASLLYLNSLFINVPASHAAATLYLAPATQTVNNGDTFLVAVRVNVFGDDKTNAVQAVLSYPADKLDVLGLDYTGSAFGIQAESTYGGGSIKMAI